MLILYLSPVVDLGDLEDVPIILAEFDLPLLIIIGDVTEGGDVVNDLELGPILGLVLRLNVGLVGEPTSLRPLAL